MLAFDRSGVSYGQSEYMPALDGSNSVRAKTVARALPEVYFLTDRLRVQYLTFAGIKIIMGGLLGKRE